MGDPAGHSLSPAIHRAGYAKHGLEWVYDPYTVAVGDLAAFVESCCADPEWVGLSVTAPHKQTIIDFGEPDESTRLVGGGNTLLFGEQSRVHNTDVSGFVRAWQAQDFPAPRSAAICGNGATARSALLAFAGLGLLREVVLLVRNPHRASQLLALASLLDVSVEVQAMTAPIPKVDVLVSTVPATAIAPVAEALASSSRIIFDVVYDSWPTALGRAGQATGVPTLDGLDLLAGQAIDQFLLMTGYQVTFEQCRSAAQRALASR